MARTSPPTMAELLRFVAAAAPVLRMLASKWGDGLPGRLRLRLRTLADRAETLLFRAGRR